MQSTLREKHRWLVPLSVWCLLSVVASVAGPFGTLNILGPLARGLYWAGVVGVSIGLSMLAIFMAGGRRGWGVAAVWGGFVALSGTLLHMLNSWIFQAWGGLMDWAYLMGIVGLITAAVHFLIWLARQRAQAVEPPSASAATFQRRLPLDLRAPLVRIESQDHYLNVVTQKGSVLILMRLGDAIEELTAQDGLQVHRSHWVALEAVEAHRRLKGRDLLVLRDGDQIPVSRTFRAAAQAAGLF